MPEWSPQSENLRVRLLDAAERSGQPGPVEFEYHRTQTSSYVQHAQLGEVANTTVAALHELREAGVVHVLEETGTDIRFYVETPPKSRSTDPAALMGKVDRLRDILRSRATGGGGYGDEDEYRRLRAELRVDPEVGHLLPDWLAKVRNLDDWWGMIQPKFGSYAERRGFLRDEFDAVITYLDETYPSVVPTPPPRPERPASQSLATGDQASGVEDFFDMLFKGTASPAVTKPSVSPAPRGATKPASRTGPTRVFVVHGHDYGPRDSIARLVSRLGFEPVILEEQPNKGRTIIEKFVDYADVAFAVIVMTPDDIGGQKGSPARPRARQNVILELGFFIGKLERGRVAAIVVGSVEPPSDIQGVLYIPFDAAGAWRGKLAREMKAAGLPVDMNLL